MMVDMMVLDSAAHLELRTLTVWTMADSMV